MRIFSCTCTLDRFPCINMFNSGEQFFPVSFLPWILSDLRGGLGHGLVHGPWLSLFMPCWNRNSVQDRSWNIEIGCIYKLLPLTGQMSTERMKSKRCIPIQEWDFDDTGMEDETCFISLVEISMF